MGVDKSSRGIEWRGWAGMGCLADRDRKDDVVLGALELFASINVSWSLTLYPPSFCTSYSL